jgi:hypothetical protein
MPWLCTAAPRGRSLPRRTLTTRKRGKGEGWRDAAYRRGERASWEGGMRDRGGILVMPGHILCLWQDEGSGFGGERIVRAKKRTVPPKHALLLADDLAWDMSIFFTGNRTEIKARARAWCGTPMLAVWGENVPPHCNCLGKLVVSAAPCRRHQRKRYNPATYGCFSELSFSLHVVPRAPVCAWDCPGSAIGPPRGRIKESLRHRVHAVFVPPALKSLQHFWRDLSFEGLRGSDERALRNLPMPDIKIKDMEKGGAHKWCINILSHGNQRCLLAYSRDFCTRASAGL